MRINMKHLPTGSISQIEEFLKSSGSIKMEIAKKKERYEFVRTVLLKAKYLRLRKKKKIIIVRYLKFLTGYSKGHVKKMIKLWRKGLLCSNSHRRRSKFPVKYFAPDIALLIDTDIAHGCLNGKATKEILRREFEVFGKAKYENICKISVSHLYNIRNHNRQYESSEALFFKHTRSVPTNIGIRKKPMPCGKPGFLRIDTVHQGDSDKKKGVYHINIVDEVTQYEMIATIEKISEKYLRPVIEELLGLFPFEIHEFHSDNGSEYINRNVAVMLNKLHIELTKSRSRQTNDNALVESKNGSIIRKLFGRNFIDQRFAPMINEFNKEYANIYLNYHRPCLFPQKKIDKLGKIRKKYIYAMTPYEKLRSLRDPNQYLKKGITFESLDRIAYMESDNDFGKKMMKAKEELFKKISNNLTK